MTHSTDRVRARDHVGPPAFASAQQTMSVPAPASRGGVRLTGPDPRAPGGRWRTAGHGPVDARERERFASVCTARSGGARARARCQTMVDVAIDFGEYPGTLEVEVSSSSE